MPVVYLVTNILNGNQYVGATTKPFSVRKADHEYAARRGKGGCKVFCAALRKYPKEAFCWEILETYPAAKEAFDAERAYIAALTPAYNIAQGGLNPLIGLPRTPAWRARISAAQKGRRLPPLAYIKAAEYRRNGIKSVVCLDDGKFFTGVKMAASHYGVRANRISTVCSGIEVSVGGFHFSYADAPIPDEKRAVLLAIATKRKSQRRGRPGRPIIQLPNGARFKTAKEASKATGVHHSIVRAICLGFYPISNDGLCFRFAEDLAQEADLEALYRVAVERGAVNRRRVFDRIDTLKKRVICLETDEIFRSASEAARKTGASQGNISTICRGDTKRRRTKGLSFRYCEDIDGLR